MLSKVVTLMVLLRGLQAVSATAEERLGFSCKAATSDSATERKQATHALPAETCYALPGLVGGDLDLAIDSMRAATARAPDTCWMSIRLMKPPPSLDGS